MSKKYILKEDVTVIKLNEEECLHDLDNDMFYEIDENVSFVIHSLNGLNSIDEIISQYMKVKKVSLQLAREIVMKSFNQLLDNRLVKEFDYE